MMTTFNDPNAAKLLDDVGRHILHLLQENARLPFSEIGRQVGLTAPAVVERVRRMEEAGIITGYHAAIDPEKVGFPVTVYITVTSGAGHCDPIYQFAVNQPAVTECYCTTGERDILIKATFESMRDLEGLVQQLMNYGKVSTSIVLSTYLPRRSVG